MSCTGYFQCKSTCNRKVLHKPQIHDKNMYANIPNLLGVRSRSSSLQNILNFKYKYYLYPQTYYGYSGGILYRDRYHIILQHVNWQWYDWVHSVIVKLWGASTNECTPSKVLELSESIFEGSIVIVPTYWTRKNPFL